jgi:hypothetical protein
LAQRDRKLPGARGGERAESGLLMAIESCCQVLDRLVEVSTRAGEQADLVSGKTGGRARQR